MWKTSGRVKIDRAKEHIKQLEVEIDAFKKRRPYFVVAEEGMSALGGSVFVVHEREPIPPLLSAITADAIHNLNTALDHLWQRSIYGDRSAANAYFPAFENAEAAGRRFKGKEKGLLKRAVDLLRVTHAFEAGNPFWTIRCFDNADKHDNLRLVACRAKSLTTTTTQSIQVGAVIAFTRAFRPDGMEILREGLMLDTGMGMSDPRASTDLAFDIAFDEGGILAGELVEPSLRALALAVEDLEVLFVAESLIQA
jgi:hypothetical protein